MLHARMIMAFRFWNILTCVVILTYAFGASDGSFMSEALDVDLSLFVRHRRSYGEQHSKHKSKEAALGIGNAVKLAAYAGKSTVFVTENCTVVVAQTGGTATLPCVVRKFSNGVVSWIRKQDYHLLTVGVTTYNTDERFMVEHVRHLQNWGLLIKHVQPTDAGLYECQVSTHPPTSIFVELKVTKAEAEIQGGPDLYIRADSMLRLVCTLRHSTETPAFVFWYHEQRMINYDPGVIVKEGKSSSVLHLPNVDKSQNGNYTCSPSNAVPASINVHVLNSTAEEKPAAMQHANSTKSSSSSFLLQCSLLIAIMTSLLTTVS